MVGLACDYSKAKPRTPHHDMEWNEMKVVMRKRFIPNHYYRDLHNKLQGLIQGSKSVDEYYKEMEIAMIWANVGEDHEATMARILNGLNHDIANIVELQHYVKMEDLLHMAIKVERQLRRKGSRSNTNFGQSSSSWKSNWRKDDVVTSKPKVETTKKKEDIVVVNKGRPKTQQRNQDIKCFKCHGLGHISTCCPNKRTMVICGGEIMIDSEEEKEPMSPLGDTSDVDLEFSVEGEVLVTRSVLSA